MEAVWEDWRGRGDGAKKLKAVVFVPEKRQVDVAMPEKLSDILRRFTPYFVGEKSVKALFLGGAARLVEIANQIGFFPAYNWQRVSLDGWESVAWLAFKRGYLVKPAACMHCPAACHRLVRSRKYGIDVDIEYGTYSRWGASRAVPTPTSLLS